MLAKEHVSLTKGREIFMRRERWAHQLRLRQVPSSVRSYVVESCRNSERPRLDSILELEAQFRDCAEVKGKEGQQRFKLPVRSGK